MVWEEKGVLLDGHKPATPRTTSARTWTAGVKAPGSEALPTTAWQGPFLNLRRQAGHLQRFSGRCEQSL